MSIESLAELLRFQSELAVDRAKQNIEQQKATAEAVTPTPAQAAYIGTIFAPGSGLADASGVFPEFPSADVPLPDYLSGEPMPSIAENIAAGGLDRYVVAPLQGLGVVGDALYAVPGAGPVLGATIGSGLKGIGALGIAARAASKGAKTEKGITTLEETKNLIKADVDEFAKDEFGFVSPTLEALIREAPPNLKGPAINDWLAANTQKGVKPKELEVLGIDEFIKANPEATLSEVVANVAPNKVQITKSVKRGEDYGQADIEFDVTEPLEDPLDGSLLYQNRIDEIKGNLGDGNLGQLQYFADEFAAQRMTPDELASYGDEFTFEDVVTRTRKANESGVSNETIDDVIDELAQQEYLQNPYELVQAKQTTPGYEADLSGTFAFGNEEVGYQLFINGERVTDTNNIAYSRAEAQIQLQNELQDRNLLDIVDTGTQYKTYVDGSLPGGSNYREVSFNLKDAPETHDLAHPGLNPEGNYIAHALIRDRKLDDGVETLHVDELQSDLHTKGSRDGYATDETQKTLRKKIAAKEKQIQAELDQIKPTIEKSMESFEAPLNAAGTPYVIGSAIRFEDATPSGVKQIVQQNIDRFYDQIKNTRGRVRQMHLNDFLNFADKNRLFDTTTYDRVEGLRDILLRGSETENKLLDLVPNYPFKDDWYVMSLKQLIKDAIDEGKDAISVSGSAPIKARYTDQYSKFYESLYDQKIPSAMKKLANKYGGKFKKGELEFEDTLGTADMNEITNRPGLENPDDVYDILEANIIEITPEMRAKIAEEGLPSFAFGGAVETPMRLTMPEDVNIFADAKFTQPKTLTEKIASGMTDLAFGRITKDDFFRDNVVRNVLAELDVPAIVQNNLLRSEDAQNFALNTLQQAIGSPVDVTALGDDRFALDYSQKLGPGILSLAGELGSDEPSARVSYDSKDFMISPSTTARFAASLDKDRGKDFSAEVTYQPDPKTFVEGQAIFGEGISPEYRLNFGRRF
jgi:hypothetical protein